MYTALVHAGYIGIREMCLAHKGLESMPTPVQNCSDLQLKPSHAKAPPGRFVYPSLVGATLGAAVDRVLDVLAAEGKWNQRAAAPGAEHPT